MRPNHVFLSTLLLSFMLATHTTYALSVPSIVTDYQVGDRLTPQPTPGKSRYKEINWDDLIPKGWDPTSDFQKIDFSKLKDSDPRAQKALQKMRDAWKNAPVEPKMDGRQIRIPGFVVPLETVHHRITEFLLVPYFGGCIHVPPPPGNQIIHVFPAKPLKKGMQSMDAVWINGKLQTLRSETGMGSASYRMKDAIIDPYQVE